MDDTKKRTRKPRARRARGRPLKVGGWTVESARAFFGEVQPMQAPELLAIRKLMGDGAGEMSQSVFGSLLGVSERTLRRYELGEVDVPLSIATRARDLHAKYIGRNP